MNNSKNFVHNLVRSLTSLEKSYVKRKIKNNEVHLLQLLEDLYKTDVCDNKELQKKFKGRKYINNLTQNKNYLRQKVMDSLIQYSIRHSAEIEKRNTLNTITILIEKGFLKKAKDLIDNTLLIANKYEDYTTCYELSVIIRKLYSSNVSNTITSEEFNTYIEKRKYYLKQLNRSESIASLSDIHLSSIPNKEKIEMITAYLKEINFFHQKALPQDYPYDAKRIFFFTKSELARFENDTTSRNFYIQKIFELFKQYPHFIENHFSVYLVDSINYLNSFLSTGNYQSFFQEHQKIMKQIGQYKNKDVSKESYWLHILQFLFPQNAYNNSEQFEKALSFAKEYQHFINVNKKDLSEHFIATSVTQIALAYLYNQQFEKVLDVIEPYVKIKIYAHQYTFRILEILSHYCLKNDMLMEYLFNSFMYYLKSTKKKSQTKGILTLKKAISTKNLKPIHNSTFESFFYLSWETIHQIENNIFKN